MFYTEYDRAARPSGGFEEWRTSLREMTPPVPEPSSAWVFAVGLLVVRGLLRRRLLG